MITLTPTAETVAAIIRPHDEHLADGLLESPAVVTTIYQDTQRENHRQVDALAVTAAWTWESRTHGPRALAVTIIEVNTGYLGADGEATVEQYYAYGALTEDEARTIAALIANGSMPRLITWETR